MRLISGAARTKDLLGGFGRRQRREAREVSLEDRDQVIPVCDLGLAGGDRTDDRGGECVEEEPVHVVAHSKHGLLLLEELLCAACKGDTHAAKAVSGHATQAHSRPNPRRRGGHGRGEIGADWMSS